MYKLKFMVVLLLLIVISAEFISCNNIAAARKIVPVKKEIGVVESDTLRVQSTIRNFLRWYKINYKAASAYPILTKDSNDNYIVNQDAYNNYLSFINSSHFVAPSYIGYWKTYFDDKAEELKNYPIKTVAPEGFDFDYVLIIQKPEVILNKIDVIRYNIISMSDTMAIVGLRLPHNKSGEYEIEMYKEKGNWQIGFIATPNYD